MKALAPQQMMSPESGFVFQNLLPVLLFWLCLHICISAESSGVRCPGAGLLQLVGLVELPVPVA